MGRIITIGREFGSGGRELGKRLADQLSCAYYDKEIVEEIAKRTDLATEYVNGILEHRPSSFFPITVGHTLHQSPYADLMMSHHAAVHREQTKVLRELAETSDCVIVGRCADYLLADLSPTRLFVYASLESKVARCLKKAIEEEGLNEKQLAKKIQKVNSTRAKYYKHYTGRVWGAPINYDLCINASFLDIKELSEAVSYWFLKVKDQK